MLPLELKKLLASHGFEVYRTLNNRVVLAERVRENLLMDGNVAAISDEPLSVRFSTRAQGSDFPAENDTGLLGRARRLGGVALARGYREVDCAVVPILDPSDSTRTLDTWYEVSFAKNVSGLEELVAEVRYALGLPKVVPPITWG